MNPAQAVVAVWVGFVIIEPTPIYFSYENTPYYFDPLEKIH